MLLIAQNLGDWAWMEAISLVASSSTQVSLVKSCGLMVGDRWQVVSLSSVLIAVWWGMGQLLYLRVTAYSYPALVQQGLITLWEQLSSVWGGH